MRTTAKEIQCSYKAGLVLCGNDEGEMVLCGSDSQRSTYHEFLGYVNENQSYPWAVKSPF